MTLQQLRQQKAEVEELLAIVPDSATEWALQRRLREIEAAIEHYEGALCAQC